MRSAAPGDVRPVEAYDHVTVHKFSAQGYRF
jgi:hypothetical protein